MITIQKEQRDQKEKERHIPEGHVLHVFVHTYVSTPRGHFTLVGSCIGVHQPGIRNERRLHLYCTHASSVLHSCLNSIA